MPTPEGRHPFANHTELTAYYKDGVRRYAMNVFAEQIQHTIIFFICQPLKCLEYNNVKKMQKILIILLTWAKCSCILNTFNETI